MLDRRLVQVFAVVIVAAVVVVVAVVVIASSSRPGGRGSRRPRLPAQFERRPVGRHVGAEVAAGPRRVRGKEEFGGGFRARRAPPAEVASGMEPAPRGHRTEAGWISRMGTRRSDSASSRGRLRSNPTVYGWFGVANTCCTGPASTTCPLYITTMRSAISATTPRSWVIRIVAASVCSFAVRSTSSTCAWIVTSSAVVGSSAISNRGRLAIAIAIMARCRMPPENSCGYCRSRPDALGTPTSSSRPTARSRAAVRERDWWMRSASVSWNPIVITGLSAVIASWKIIPIDLPLTDRICRFDMRSRSRPSNIAVPPTMRPGGCGTRPSNAMTLTLLPEPDSPTIPRVSPGWTSKLTPSTAFTAAEPSPNATRRSVTESSGSSATPSPSPVRPWRLSRPPISGIGTPLLDGPFRSGPRPHDPGH